MSPGIGSEFMRGTRIGVQPEPDQQKGLPPPPLQRPHDPSGPTVRLPKADELVIPSADLWTIMAQRRTLRDYARMPLSLDELSFLLWCCQGVQSVDNNRTLRPVPSAGARHAFETYILVNNVVGVPAGLYRFVAIEHLLVEENTAATIADEVVKACRNQRQIKAAAVTLIWTADTYRMTHRYGERGYRYLHLDAGHACQNLYLAAEAVGCGVCAIAAFDDDALNRVLGLDGESQFALYAATVGKRK